MNKKIIKENPTYQPKPFNLTKKGVNDNYTIYHRQCQEVNGKYYLIIINPYTNVHLLSLPITTNINELDNGLYVYVMLSLNNEEPIMYYIKTNTISEFGTKHHQLIHRISCQNDTCKKYKLYYAGEIEKNNNQVSLIFIRELL